MHIPLAPELRKNGAHGVFGFRGLGLHGGLGFRGWRFKVHGYRVVPETLNPKFRGKLDLRSIAVYLENVPRAKWRIKWNME